MQKLLLVDGNSLINRAYYATNLTNGATYGFLNMFLKEIQDSGATHIAVAFDVRAKTFRHEMYTEYKANRKGMPDDLAEQLLDLKKLLGIMGVKMFEKAGFEADDIIGTIAGKMGGDFQTIVLTADRDLLQLVNDHTYVYLTKTGVTKTEIYDTARIQSEFGITPIQLIEVKALMGDPSDNVPGVKGIGEKTALKLVRQHGCVENLNYPEATLCKKLVTVKCDVDVDFDIKDLKFSLPMPQAVYKAFKERNFHTLCNRTNLFSNTGVPVQQSFF